MTPEPKNPRKPIYTRRSRGRGRLVTITEAGRDLITAMAAEGQAQRTMARALGISRSTLTEIKDRDPRVTEAWEDGHAKLADTLTHILLTNARKGDTQAATFLARARLGWTTDGPKEEKAPSVVIHLPDAHSPEAYMKLIEHRPMKQLPAPESAPDILSRSVTR